MARSIHITYSVGVLQKKGDRDRRMQERARGEVREMTMIVSMKRDRGIRTNTTYEHETIWTTGTRRSGGTSGTGCIISLEDSTRARSLKQRT